MTTVAHQSPSFVRMLHEESFEPRVFWTVNTLLLTLLIIVLVWCFRGGAEKISEYLTREAAGMSDSEYLRRVRERRERQAQGKKQSPEERLTSLKTSFQRNKVHMVSKGSAMVMFQGILADKGSVVESNDFAEESAVEVVENEAAREEEQSLASVPGEVESSCDGLGTEASNNEPSDIENGAHIDEENMAAVIVEPSSSEERVSVEGGDKKEDNPLAVELATPDVENATPLGPESMYSVEHGTSFDAEEGCSEDDNIITQQDHTAQGYIKLRLPSGKKRTVPNCCAVCLCPYEEGETIVWSSNRACKHAFHEECVMEWLIKMQDSTPCPCCRQDFIDVDKHKKKQKNILVDPHSFDVSVIRF